MIDNLFIASLIQEFRHPVALCDRKGYVIFKNEPLDKYINFSTEIKYISDFLDENAYRECMEMMDIISKKPGQSYAITVAKEVKVKMTSGWGDHPDYIFFQILVPAYEKHSDTFYHKLLEVANAPITVYDQEGYIVDTFGYDENARNYSIGRNICDFLPQHGKKTQKHIKECIELGKTIELFEKVEEHERDLFYHIFFSPIEGPNGESYAVSYAYEYTELEEAKQKIERINEQLEIAQKVSDFGYFTFNLQEENWSSSTGLDAIIGVEAENPRMVDAWFNLVHPDDKEAIFSYFTGIIDNRTRYDKKFRIVNQRSREVRHVHVIGEFYPPNAENPLLIGTVKDITDIQKKEKALTQSEERFRSLFEQSKVGLVIHDLDGVIQDINPRIEELLELTKSEVIGKRIFEFFPDEHIEQRASDLEALRAEGYVTKENKLNVKGKIKDVEVFASVYQVQDKARVQVLIVDITDKKIAEEELRKTEKHLNSLLATISEFGIFRLEQDPDSEALKVVLVSPSMSAILGIPKEELHNFQSWLAHLDPSHFHELLEHVENAKKPPFTLEYEVKINHPEKGERWLQIRSNSIPYENHPDVAQYANGIVVDITERHRVQQYLVDSKTQLEASNEEYQKMNENLEKSNQAFEELTERLKRANDELDSFVYRVSHDLKSPINSSIGLTKLIDQSDSIDEIKQYTALQKKSLGKLDKFIHDILDYSRNTRMELTCDEIDFRHMIEEILESQSHVSFHDIQIKKNIVQDDSFYSDQLRMKIILQNLISNAFKYQNPSQDSKFVSINVETDPKQTVIEIKDNGLGIGIEHQERIFDMFYRAHDTNPGSGLGLYIVKDCIDKLGGEIRLKSIQNAGTTFSVRIPSLNGK